MVRYLFYTIGDLTYQSPLVVLAGVEAFVIMGQAFSKPFLSPVDIGPCPLLSTIVPQQFPRSSLNCGYVYFVSATDSPDIITISIMIVSYFFDGLSYRVGYYGVEYDEEQ